MAKVRSSKWERIKQGDSYNTQDGDGYDGEGNDWTKNARKMKVSTMYDFFPTAAHPLKCLVMDSYAWISIDSAIVGFTQHM